jgi:hypothetical protein
MYFLLRIISPSLVRSPHGGALLSMHMTQVHDHDLHVVEEILEYDKKVISLLLYHLTFIVGLVRGPPTWYQRQEVSSSSPGYTYYVAHNYLHLQMSIR